MGRERNLIGRIVALDPDNIDKDLTIYTKEPAMVLSVDTKQSIVLMTFADETQCEVEFEKLIMLRKLNDIMTKLVRNFDIPTDDFQTITSVSNRMIKGDFSGAIKLALTSAVTKKYCTINCGDWIQKEKQKISRRRL